MNTITSHGFRFNIEATGFLSIGETEDRDNGIEAIEAHLDAMDAAAVAAAHAADRAWQDADCAGDRPAIIEQIEAIGNAAATAGWHKPDAASLMLSAAL